MRLLLLGVMIGMVLGFGLGLTFHFDLMRLVWRLERALALAMLAGGGVGLLVAAGVLLIGTRDEPLRLRDH